MSVDFYTLDAARTYLKENWDAGVRCPCCNQNVKRYKRKFNRAMAVCLVELYKKNTADFLHVHDLQNNRLFRLHMNGGNFATMKYWGVIEQSEKDDEDTVRRTSGRWRITEKGIDFVNQKIQIPKYVYTYNMTLVGISQELTDIKESLTEKFNYRELMDGRMGDENNRPRPGVQTKLF